MLGRCRYGCPDNGYGARLLTWQQSVEMLFPNSVNTYEATKDMRCPDTSYYMLKFLEISECYEKRGDKESLKKSYDQLKYVDDDYENGLSCVRVRDAKVIKDSLERVKKKLDLITPREPK